MPTDAPGLRRPPRRVAPAAGRAPAPDAPAEGPARGGRGPGGTGSPRRRLGSGDARAVGVLVVLPLLFFVLPALAGHPQIVGDDLLQNFPLRVLTGRQLRQGHLPLWNPYIWSGSPLLGGLNAGSFYPCTFAFAVLGPVAAWVVNLLAVYWSGGLSMYALTRQYGLRPLPCLLGALTYAFGGTMAGQFVHIGVVEGMAWTPLLVLAELRLAWAALGTGPAGAPSESGPRPVWRWVALLALVVGLEALTGEPRAMAETEVVGAAVALWCLLRPYAGRAVPAARRGRFLVLVLLGAAWGVALAAAQLAPGWSFIRASQRAVESYQYFGTGSLRVSWSLLLLVPDLFGGTGHLSQPHYFNHYNLPEVTGYVGLLPVGAALVLAWRSVGRRRDARAADYGMWLALGALGLVLAWGTFTPLGHLWAQIPLFGKTRLQSRNLEIVDLALAVLLACFCDRLLGARARAAGPLRALASAPALGALALCVLVLAAPVPVEEWLGTSAAGARLARQLWPWLAAEMGVACAVAALVWVWHRLGASARRGALVAVVVADLALFVLATSTAVQPPSTTSAPTRARAVAVLGHRGRFAFADTTVSFLDTLIRIGQPDLNESTRLPSVQGYGSIVSEAYAAATGTHALATIDACAVARGAFVPLRLSTLVVFPSDLVRTVAATPPAAPPSSCAASPAPGSAGTRTLYLGWPVELTGATVVLAAASGAGGAGPPPRVEVLGPHGRARAVAETVRAAPGGWTVRFDRPQRATGIVVRGAGAPVSAATTVTNAAGVHWAFEGLLQTALDTASWRLAGSYRDRFGVFRTTRPPRPPVWLATPSPGSSVREVRATDWGTSVDRVVATRPVTVVWSEADLRGWHATLTPLGAHGTARRVAVGRDGLVQSVHVPPGRWLLTFSYRPGSLDLGLAGSAAAAAGFVALGAVALLRRRGRARPGPGAARPVA